MKLQWAAETRTTSDVSGPAVRMRHAATSLSKICTRKKCYTTTMSSSETSFFQWAHPRKTRSKLKICSCLLYFFLHLLNFSLKSVVDEAPSWRASTSSFLFRADGLLAFFFLPFRLCCPFSVFPFVLFWLLSTVGFLVQGDIAPCGKWMKWFPSFLISCEEKLFM